MKYEKFTAGYKKDHPSTPFKYEDKSEKSFQLVKEKNGVGTLLILPIGTCKLQKLAGGLIEVQVPVWLQNKHFSFFA